MNQAFSVLGVSRAVWIASSLFLAAPVAHAQQADCDMGIIVVHGGSGSAQQYETLIQRFDSNGVAPECFRAVEYNSGAIQMILPQVLMQIDAAAADLMQATGLDQVNLMGHSLGTAVSQSYLSTPERASNIANYVNIDGRGADALPGGVRTLALTAAGTGQDRDPVVGGTNVAIPDQQHVEVVSSAESFAQMFQFLTGQAAATTDVVPQQGPVAVEGRAVLFPANAGPVANSTVMVFELDPATGRRAQPMMGVFAMPVASLPIAADGSFEATNLMSGTPHEFAVIRDGQVPARTFVEGFIRQDRFLRLLLGRADEGLALLMDRDPNDMAIVVVRQQELRGTGGPSLTQPGIDILTINGVNVLNATTAPCCTTGTSSIALVVQDLGSDGVTNLNRPQGVFSQVGFITTADRYVPGTPPFLTNTLTITPRGNTSATRTVNFPAISSFQAAVTIQLSNVVQ